MNLRPYQSECISAIPQAGRYLIQMATGLGKTVTFANIPRRGRVLILSHREELVRQPIKYYDCRVGIEQAKDKSNGEDVISASVQTLVKRLDRFASDEFDIVIVDEAHHAAAPTYRKILNHFEPRLVLGFTATPNRGDQVRLDDVFDKIIFRRDLKWGIQNGYLSDIHCLRVNIGFDLRSVAKRLDDYALDQLNKAVNQDAINKAVAEAYQKYATGQTLIFASSVEHAQALAKEIDGAVAVTGQTAEREQILQAFTRGDIPCLVNCMVFTEGTDLPNISTIIMARPTANTSLYTQMVGRGLRLYKGKERLTLIDCVGIAGRLNLCTAPTLLGINAEQVPKRYQSEIEGDLFDLPAKIEKFADTPESWIRNIETVNIWASEQQIRTYNMNLILMPDGSLKISLPNRTSYTIPAADKLGKVTLGGAEMSLQDAIDGLYKHLLEIHSGSKAIWDLSIAKKTWGRFSASDKQKNIIKRRYPDVETERLSKLEANQILARIFR